MAGNLLSELTPTVLSRLRAQIGADLELKRHPQFEQAWPVTVAVVLSHLTAVYTKPPCP
jgi:hypothetical protein